MSPLILRGLSVDWARVAPDSYLREIPALRSLRAEPPRDGRRERHAHLRKGPLHVRNLLGSAESGTTSKSARIGFACQIRRSPTLRE